MPHKGEMCVTGKPCSYYRKRFLEKIISQPIDLSVTMRELREIRWAQRALNEHEKMEKRFWYLMPVNPMGQKRRVWRGSDFEFTEESYLEYYERLAKLLRENTLTDELVQNERVTKDDKVYAATISCCRMREFLQDGHCYNWKPPGCAGKQ